MLTAAWTRIAAVFLITVWAAGCGGGGGGGAVGGAGSGGTGSGGTGSTPPLTPTIDSTPTNASTPSGAPSTTTATLWLGNVTDLGVSAYVSQAAPTSNFGAWVIANVTVPTTFYLRGSYSNTGIASIKGSPAADAISFNITFKSPASLGVGIYTDTITMEGCYDSACNQQIQSSPLTIKVTYVVKADPVTLTSISPSGVVAGSPGFTLTLTGTHFSKDSIVIFNTSPQPTTFVSPTQLTASIAANMLVTPEEGIVTVESSSQENADISAPATLHVLAPAPDPTVTSLAPNSAIVGSPDFTLTVNGANFTIASVVLWGGAPVPTTLVSPSQLTASISASQIASIGTTPVAVQGYSNPVAPVSNAVNFTIAPVPPLTLNSVFPSIITAGGSDLTLTALGLSFAPNAIIKWNGTALATSQVSSSMLRATVPAADIATAGLASITVQNPSAGGATSAALPVRIQNQTPDAVAIQITPDHAGAVTFKSLSFPSARAWSVDLGGAPSYALIADGKVFVTVKIGLGSSTGSQLVALDQASGHTVWGPIQLPEGWAFPAYDGGKVFVITSAGGVGPGTLQSYDAESGSVDWTKTFPLGIGFENAPSAANGILYLGAANTGTYLIAIDEGSGSTLWQQSVLSGTGSTPAVTAQGVYVAVPCGTVGFAPLTGASLFSDSGGCEGGGGATAVVANNVFYSLMGQPANGIYVSATTGAQLGTFVADVVPAINSTSGFFLKSGTLTARSLSANSALWSFQGDGGLISSPIIVNQAVIVGSSSGQLYALDAATGAQLWTTNAGGAITGGTSNVISGLAAGDGLLVVPAGSTLSAYTLSTNP
jgi:outer membrane protein assembly factor BamB